MNHRNRRWLYWLGNAVGLFVCSSALMAEETADSAVLTIGSKAPALDIAHWLSDGDGKFKHVTDFEQDHVYVVEFWATWCGPCVESMPHLAQTQQKYADNRVQIISISDESPLAIQAFLQRKVPERAEGHTYANLTSVYCLTTDPDNSVERAYMEASGQYGIPTAFIVGKTGLIEWIGHPVDIDQPLEQVVNDRWDRDAFLATFKVAQERDLTFVRVKNLVLQDRFDEALQRIAQWKQDGKVDDAMLDQLAWYTHMELAEHKLLQGEDVKTVFATLDAFVTKTPTDLSKNLKFGKCQLLLTTALQTGKHADLATSSLLDLASEKKANHCFLNILALQVAEALQSKKEISEKLIAAATEAAERSVREAPDDSSYIDTLAHLVYLRGDLARAIELETQALRNATPQTSEEIKQFLERLKSEIK